MIFGIGTLLAFISNVMTLEPGDLVSTGTPEGVGPLRRATASRSRSRAWACSAIRSRRATASECNRLACTISCHGAAKPKLGVCDSDGPGPRACGASSNSFRRDGFYGAEQAYRIVHGPNDALAPGADWYVDNYQIDKKGGLGAPKGGPDYQHVIKLDSDGDGELDVRRKVTTYELLLRHLKNDGHIWVRNLTASTQFRETDLRVLALNYVDAVSGTGEMVSDPQGETKVTIERRFATRVLDAAEATLDGRPAYTVTFEVANVDQLQLSQDSRWERASVILVRPGFHYRVNEIDFPVFMLLGYSNRPEDFEQGRAAFEQLVGRVQFLSEKELVASRTDEIFACEDGSGTN